MPVIEPAPPIVAPPILVTPPATPTPVPPWLSTIAVDTPRPNAIAYNATKHGVSGITKSVALEGRPYNIACGQIDIGNAATDMTQKMSGGVLQANGTLAAEPRMNVNAVADAIVYMAGLPLDANVLTITVMATNMPYVGRG